MLLHHRPKMKPLPTDFSVERAFLLALSAFVSRFRVFPFFFFRWAPNFFISFFYLLGLRAIKPAKCFWPRQGDDADIEDPRENTLFNFEHIFAAPNSSGELVRIIQSSLPNLKHLAVMSCFNNWRMPFPLKGKRKNNTFVEAFHSNNCKWNEYCLRTKLLNSCFISIKIDT